MHPWPFFGVFGIRSGPSQGSSRMAHFGFGKGVLVLAAFSSHSGHTHIYIYIYIYIYNYEILRKVLMCGMTVREARMTRTK